MTRAVHPRELQPVTAPRKRQRLRTRFEQDDEDPRASLVNLVDVMLVFACGLLAAVSAASQRAAPVEVARGKTIERPLQGKPAAGAGYQSVGQVYRDPKTGKLILIEGD